MLKSYLIANPKGGCGKTTLATNLAGYFARRGGRVMLGDIDRQQSAREWLALRSPALPPIASWEIRPGQPARPPHGTQRAVLDTPAGLHGRALETVLGHIHRVIVPLQPSLFDILATRTFIDALLEEKARRPGQLAVAVVGMRVDARTRAAAELARFVEGLGVPVLGFLRDTQLYVQAAAHGMTLFDLSPARAEKDLPQWQGIVDWVETA